MFKAVVFDFDGVLVESVAIKTKAFRELFSDYPEHLDEFINYHEYHGGVSRFVKIGYFFETYLGKKLTDNELADWCQRYSRRVVEHVVSARSVTGMKDLLDYCAEKFDLFVASGTPRDELRQIIQRRGMAHYFKGVYGSPMTKKDHVKNIISEGYHPEEMCFIGDSVTDYDAAEAFQVPCIIRCEKKTADWMEKADILSVCRDMKDVLVFFRKVERRNGVIHG